jgi:hypothetical protein
VTLVVPGVEHYAVVPFEVRGLERKRAAWQVFGGSHDIANTQIEEEVRDEQVDPGCGPSSEQKAGTEIA